MKVFVVLAALVAVAVASTAYPKPAAYPSPSYPAATTYTKSYDYPAQPYNFAWAVKDDPSYNDYNQQESSDGKVVSGSYRVLLPDGRIQTVTYKADDYSGYVAEVKYEGVAKYDYKPAYKAAPSYPTPTYKPYPAPAPAYPKPAY